MHFSCFSGTDDTDDQGMGLVPILALRHKLNLLSGLPSGQAAVGVQFMFPVEGVDVIRGNDWAGEGVWPGIHVGNMAYHLPAIAVTGAMSRANFNNTCKKRQK